MSRCSGFSLAVGLLGDFRPLDLAIPFAPWESRNLFRLDGGGLCFFHAKPNKASELGRIGVRTTPGWRLNSGLLSLARVNRDKRQAVDPEPQSQTDR